MPKPRPTHTRTRRILVRAVDSAAVGLLLLSLLLAFLVFAGPSRHQILFALAAALPLHVVVSLSSSLLLAVRRRHHLLRVALVISALLPALSLDAHLRAAPFAAHRENTDTTLLVANLYADNRSLPDLVRHVVELSPDVLVTAESFPAAVSALADALEGYERVSATAAGWIPHDDVIIWSRLPVTALPEVRIGERLLPRAEIQTPAGPLRVIGVHLSSPTGSANIARLPGELADVRGLELGDAPTVLAGDFNTPALDPVLRSLEISSSPVVDAALASGAVFAPTWPAIVTDRSPLRTGPILDLDHVLLHRTFVTSHRVVPLPGSDHCGVLVSLRPF